MNVIGQRAPAPAPASGSDPAVERVLSTVFDTYGFDFRHYARAHMKRRLVRRMTLMDLPSLDALDEALRADPSAFRALLSDLTVHTTEMFRDPGFYRAFREEVVPVLRTYPSNKIWMAGCSSGEEIYSMAILLREEELERNTLVYATDLSDAIIERAKNGIFPVDRMKDYTLNYQKGGGAASFADYYAAHYGSVRFDPSLRERVVFATHNLAVDGVFGEMNVVVCRNVLIYFDRALQDDVLHLFTESLCRRGFLCIGMKESLRFSSSGHRYEPVDDAVRIFRRKD